MTFWTDSLDLIQGINFVFYFGKYVLLYVETVAFDENFWQQMLPWINFYIRRAVAPELFSIHMVAERTKNKRKNDYFNSRLS